MRKGKWVMSTPLITFIVVFLWLTLSDLWKDRGVRVLKFPLVKTIPNFVEPRAAQQNQTVNTTTTT